MRELDEVIQWLRDRALLSCPPMYIGTGAGTAGELEKMALSRLEAAQAHIAELETQLAAAHEELRGLRTFAAIHGMGGYTIEDAE
jgi:tartrate dehydratase alpha subunit/fumarate hydratase class I-like protein